MVEIRSTAITCGVCAASIGAALVAYNVRWKYISTVFGRQKARTLPVVKVVGNTNKRRGEESKNEDSSDDAAIIPIVLIHGMWHDPSYFAPLQRLLAERGRTSYAVSMLPGERFLPGGSQAELVADLELTLSTTAAGGGGRYVLLGHSQGGLVAQSALINCREIRENCLGAVLLGTFPLGFVPPAAELCGRHRNMYRDVGYAFICLFGRLMNARYAKHIFLLPGTDETSPEMSGYIQGLLRAPSDGLVTGSHFPSKPVPLNTPALVLGASGDIIYPPDVLAKEFDVRFPNADHVICDDQAHCFMDPGWEESMARPLMDWIDSLLGNC